ncbi:peptidoglycan-binding domain-containing protein [Flavobacterium sp. '19STA2R22 D10 B1']|uniref:peptidoglycan-binding domain-containing protein n=1 Tax=Flavobacterium aerium TaxID=3037261 RepID=UPI00278C4877|nr:peptidoglycan-binding domain-containing protein [Flavobacterium sp. '19STA2R22 D10 B1']
MSIYISKKAINNISLPVTNIPNSVRGGGELRSLILNTNLYLVGLAKNDDVAYGPLGKNTKSSKNNSAVRIIRLALNIVHYLNKDNHNFGPAYPLDSTSFNFDDNLESAVKKFQEWVGLPTTGIVDTQTLLALDTKIHNDVIQDYDSGDIIGKSSNNSFSFEQERDPDGKYKYVLNIGGEKIEFDSDEPIKGSYISLEESKVYVALPNSGFGFLDTSNDKSIEKLNISRANKGFSPIDHLSLDKDTTKIKMENVEGSFLIPMDNITLEAENTPPLLFDDPEAKIYKVKSGENFSTIVEENYYGTGDYIIKDPYNDDVPIFTLPNRVPFEGQQRSEDARFQFYLNLLYYYNSSEETIGVIKEWGMKRDSLQNRYKIDHLESTNLFDNKFDPNDNNTYTGLPNYYRFLKKQEELDPNTKIIFQPNGETSSFIADGGKNIRIPSRKFADSLYYFLNFRHYEMLEAYDDPAIQNAQLMRYISELALQGRIGQMTSTSIFNILFSAVKEATIALYSEVWSFYKNAYRFAIESLAKYWPRGLGGICEATIGITWGLFPIATDAMGGRSIWRKMTPQNELTIMYRSEGSLYVGGDVATGYSYSLGFSLGSGKTKKPIGINALASIESGFKFKGITEYEFPIRPEETGLLAMIVTVYGGFLVKAASEILNCLNLLNISPRNYLNNMSIVLEKSTKVSAAAQVGFIAGNPNPDKNIKLKKAVETSSEQNEKKSFVGVDNILSNLPGIGIQISGEHVLGYEFSYEAEYNNNPLLPEVDGRVASSTKVELTFNAQNQLNVGAMGNFLQRLLMKPSVAFINRFFSLLTSDTGILLGVAFEGTRKVAASVVTLNDVSLTGNNIPIVEGIAGAIRYVTGSNWTWESNVKIGSYTGDVNTFCMPGQETMIRLNLYKLWQNLNFDEKNIADMLSFMQSYTFRTKVGAGINQLERRNLKAKANVGDKVVNNYSTTGNIGDREVKSKRDFLQRAKTFGIDAGIYLDVSMELSIEPITNVLTFYYRKLLLIEVLGSQNLINIVNNNIKNHRNTIIKYLANKPNIVNTEETETELIINLGSKFYEQMFKDGLLDPNGAKYPDGTLMSVPVGLNKYIVDTYATELNNPNFLQSMMTIFTAYDEFNNYLNGILTEEGRRMGVDDIVNSLSFLGAMTNINAALEVKLGIAASSEHRVDTIRGAVSGMAGLIDSSVLYKNGKWFPFQSTDVLKDAQTEIHKTLLTPSSGHKYGVQEVLNTFNI